MQEEAVSAAASICVFLEELQIREDERAGEERNRKADLRCTGTECDVRWHDRQESGP